MLKEIRETRKDRFLSDFNNSGKYLALRDNLKKSIFRLVVEKYKKIIGPKGLKGVDRAKFKADLYTYLNE
jgi:hypothetical protein